MKKTKDQVLIACSGGPDSMALLAMCKDVYDVSVAHVNYHKRKSANRDERIVRDYCLRHGIPFHKKDYKDDGKAGNFQDKARIFRYRFFAQIIEEKGLKCVLVAHHRDDLIETYLMQKERKVEVAYYGLKRTNVLYGVKVKRPLLKYSKDQLLKYCEDNAIPYGVDESNLSNAYARNRIRHEIVEKMSEKEKKEVLKEIREKNKELKEEIKRTGDYLKGRKKMSIKEFNDYDDKVRLLRMFIGVNVSFKEANELIRQIKEAGSFETLLKDRYLVKEYGYLETYLKEDDYEYELDEIRCFKTGHFKIDRKGGNKEGVSLEKEDFPLTIRNYREGDAIAMRYGTKKINRFFIDNKIPSKERKTWPILCNAKGDVILVPGIGCDRYHYSAKHDLYMLKL